MIKGIFLLEGIDKKKADQAFKLGAKAIFTGYESLIVNRDLIGKLKNRGIKVYAEVGLFVGEEWWQKCPDSRPFSQSGKPIEKINWYAGVCPNHLEVRKEKLAEIKSLIGKFDIDGVWLDFIRYPCHWEEVRNREITEYCFCQNCVTGFEKSAKIPRVVVRQRAEFPRGGGKTEELWIQWKCDQITNFVAEIRILINQSGKNIKLGMFSIPWKKEDFNGAIRKIIGQDFRSLAKYIDFFSPMVYQKFCGRDVEWIGKIVRYMAEITGKPILPIIQTEDRAGKISQEEFRQEIIQSTKPPSAGVIVFFLEDLLKDEDKIEVIKEKFV